MSEQNKKIIYVSKEVDEKITDGLRAEVMSHGIEIRVLEKDPLVIGVSGKDSLKMSAEHEEVLKYPLLKEDNAEVVILDKEPLVMELSGEELLKMGAEHVEILDLALEYENKQKPKKYVPKKMGNEIKAKIKNIRGKRYGR